MFAAECQILWLSSSKFLEQIKLNTVCHTDNARHNAYLVKNCSLHSMPIRELKADLGVREGQWGCLSAHLLLPSCHSVHTQHAHSQLSQMGEHLGQQQPIRREKCNSKIKIKLTAGTRQHK